MINTVFTSKIDYWLAFLMFGDILIKNILYLWLTNKVLSPVRFPSEDLNNKLSANDINVLTR